MVAYKHITKCMTIYKSRDGVSASGKKNKEWSTFPRNRNKFHSIRIITKSVSMYVKNKFLT